MGHGQPIRMMSSFSYLASMITELCLPTFTDVLSTPNETHLSQVISFLVNALSMAVNIPTAVDEVVAHMSKFCYDFVLIDVEKTYRHRIHFF